MKGFYMHEKILHIIDNDSRGGAQKILYDLLKESDIINTKQILFVINSSEFKVFDELTINKNIQIYKWSKFGNLSIILTYPFLLTYLFFLSIKYNVKTFNVHLPNTTIILTPLFIMFKLFKKKIVVTIYSSKIQVSSFFYFFYIKFSSLYATSFISVLHDNREISQYTNKFHILPFWTNKPSNYNQYDLITNILKNNSTDCKLLSVARTSKDKLIDEYFDIFKILKKEQVKFEYVFVGYGELLDECRLTISKNNWNNIHFVGYLKDCESIYLNTDFFITTNLGKHISVTATNALRFGKLVISLNKSTQNKSIEFLNNIPGVNGFIISCKNNLSVVKAISKLNKNSRLKNYIEKRLKIINETEDANKSYFINRYYEILNQ
jgi:glycosyltransferase involved in cell wall biosynthesis